MKSIEYFAVLPIQKFSDKKIGINDSDSVQIGYFKRNYKSTFDKALTYLPFSFLETRSIIGETDGYCLKIMEQSLKSNLIQLKWDVYLKGNNEEKAYLLVDKTKVTTNPRMLYRRNSKDYIFKKDAFNRTCTVLTEDSNIICAEIKIEKLIPPNIRIIVKTNELTTIEVLGIYYIMNLVY